MKFLCGSCRTKYQISDEKVRGKILTIRCKKCSAKIVVRESLVRAAGGGTAVAPLAEAPSSAVESRALATGGGQSRASASTALASAYEGAMHPGAEAAEMLTSIAPVPANLENAGVEWYIAIDGVQLGPFAYAEVVRKLQTGEVVGRHYVWHDGMDNWTRVRDVADLARHVPEQKRRPPPPPPAHEAEAPYRSEPEEDSGFSRSSSNSGADILDLRQKRAELEGRQVAAVLEPAPTEHTEIAPSESGLSGGASGRADELDQVLNEALGIDDAAEEATDHGQRRNPIEVAATEGVGLARSANHAGVDPGRHAMMDGEDPPPSIEDLASFESHEDIFASVPRASETSDHVRESTRFFVAAAGVNKKKSRNRIAVVAGVLAVVGLSGFMAAWAMGYVEVEIPGIGNPFQVARDRPIEQDEGLAVTEDVEKLKKQLAGNRRRRRRAGSRARRSSDEAGGFVTDKPREETFGSRGADVATSLELGASGTAGGLGRSQVGDAQLPSSGVEQMQPVEKKNLDESAVARVVRARRKSVSICYEQSLRGQEDLRGKLEFTVTILPSGGVSRVRVETVAFRGSRLGQCIADKIKDWQFPPFSGEAQDVVVPFVLEKGSY